MSRPSRSIPRTPRTSTTRCRCAVSYTHLWANVYTTDQIVVIDPATGVVEGVVDLAGLLPETEMTATTDVLNGIAYDAEGDRIFVTGKNWPKLYEIEITEK